MAAQKKKKTNSQKPNPRHGNKLATLPSNAQVTKRPLLRPPIPSRYSNADTPKVVYISSSTPFLSAVKRVEKLLQLADQRLVQAATSLAKNTTGGGGRRRRAHLSQGADAVDEIAEIARSVEQLKRTGGGGGGSGGGGRGEEVLVKGTGRAIAKVMEIGCWFQQREQQYLVAVRTGTVSGIDDVEYERERLSGTKEDEGEGEDQDQDRMLEDKKEKKETHLPSSSDGNGSANVSRVMKREETEMSGGTVAVSETRIRNMSMLELRIALR